MGAIVVATIAIVFLGAITIPKLFGPPMNDVTVEFPFSQGVDGIGENTPIFLAGLEIGHVVAVAFISEAPNYPAHFRVDCSIIASVSVPRTATIRVSESVLGAGTALIVQLPVASGSSRVGPDDHLMAAPTQTTMEVLFGEMRANALLASIKSIRDLDLKDSIRDGGERFATLKGDIHAVNLEVRADWDAWQLQANAIVDGYDSARVQFDGIYALVAPGMTLDREKLEPAIDRIQAHFSESVEVISTLRKRWQEQILPPLSDLIDRLKKDCAIIERDYTLAVEMLKDSTDAFAASKADLQIAGGQLDRSVREITLMPWTLLGGAFEGKGEAAQFTMIARELVRSTAELHMSVIVARELMKNDPKLAARYPELVELLNRWMAQAAASQSVAGKAVLDRLIGSPTP